MTPELEAKLEVFLDRELARFESEKQRARIQAELLEELMRIEAQRDKDHWLPMWEAMLDRAGL